MTSFEPELPPADVPPPEGVPAAPEAEPEPTPPARVIAGGHLHPGMLFLRLLDGLRGAVVPVAIALVTGQYWLIYASAIYFVFALAYALARYLTFQYVLTEEELITTEGILHRQERRIPVNRIQDLNFESTLIRRIFGLVVVSVETASAQGSEARLDSLSRARAEHLREALYHTRAARGLQADAAEEQPQEHLLFRSDGGELFLLGLTNNRIGVILAAMFGVYELALELGLAETVGVAITAWVASLPRMLAAVIVLSILFLALLGGWAVSIAASFLMFWGFQLTIRDDIFQRRYGLITTRAASLPRRKIQRVLLEQTFLRRITKLTVVRADSAGSGMDPREEVRGGRDVVVPLTDVRRSEALVPVLLPGFPRDPLSFTRVSPRVVTRIFLKGVVWTALALGVGLPMVGPVALLALVFLPVAWAIGVLSYHNLGYAEIAEHFGLRWGILGRYRAMLPLRKVQGVVFRASPIDRLLKLGQLTVYVAGGSPTTLRYLPRSEARELQARLARQAAASRFVW